MKHGTKSKIQRSMEHKAKSRNIAHSMNTTPPIPTTHTDDPQRTEGRAPGDRSQTNEEGTGEGDDTDHHRKERRGTDRQTSHEDNHWSMF